MRHSIGSALRPRSESTKSERFEPDIDLLAHGDAGTRSSVDETEADETIVEPDQNNGGLRKSHSQPSPDRRQYSRTSYLSYAQEQIYRGSHYPRSSSKSVRCWKELQSW